MTTTNGSSGASKAGACTVETVHDKSISATDSKMHAKMPDSPTERRIKQRTLLQEVEENIAQSMLVFLLADLRLMSATGRIETKYETIAIASDPPTRSTSQELAGMKGTVPKNQVSESLVQSMEEGLSPAQIMGVLIIELKKTVEARREEEERLRAEGIVALPKARWDNDRDEKFTYFAPDKSTGGMRIRANEEDMHSLLRAYADMIGEDLKADVPHIARRASTLYVSSEVSNSGRRQLQHQSDLARIDEGDDEDSTKSENNAIDTTGRTWRFARFGRSTTEEDSSPKSENEGTVRTVENSTRSENDVDGTVANVEQSGNDAALTVGQAVGKMTTDAVQQMQQQVQTPLQQRAEQLRQSIVTGALYTDQETRTNAEFGEVTDALFKQGASQGSLRVTESAGQNGQGSTQEELLAFMEKAVESRVFGKLDFLADFFREGTVSKLMAESNARLVWMNDWYPLKDLTYAIAVDKEKKRVLVVFRGAITRQDWSRSYQSRKFEKIENPIDDDYEGKTDHIDVSRGFYQYLFRVRKDTGTTKYDEITNMVCEYGKERIGDKFHLVVTGHSLGGAMSTMFAFFASADERFTTNGPVKCFNFGSPYVGGLRFLLAFQHLERQQKLQYARFFNHNDIVAHLPFNFRLTRYGGKFRPVGISIRLPSVPFGLWGRIRGWHPNVFYVKKEGFLRSYWRAIRDNFLLKIPLPPWRFAEMHTLNEMQKRLMYGQRVGAGDDFALLSMPIDELYDKMIGTSYCDGGAASEKPNGAS